MQYYVIGPDGNKYGPADVPTLKQWVVENRLGPTSMLEDFTSGQRLPAGQVPGLFEGAPVTTAEPGAGPAMGAPVTGAVYQPAQQYQGQANYPRDGVNPEAGKTMIILSWVFSSVGILCCPIIFSTLGIVFAFIGGSQGHPNSTPPKIFGFVSLVVGFTLGILSNQFLQNFLQQMQQQRH